MHSLPTVRLSVRPSVCCHSTFGIDWPLTLNFCTWVGHDHSSQGIEGQCYRSRPRSWVRVIWSAPPQPRAVFSSCNICRCNIVRNVKVSWLESRPVSRPKFWAPYRGQNLGFGRSQVQHFYLGLECLLLFNGTDFRASSRLSVTMFNQPYSDYLRSSLHFAFGANPPSSTQLEGTPLPFPKLHTGPCSNVGMRRGTDTHVDRHTDRRWSLQYISLGCAKCEM